MSLLTDELRAMIGTEAVYVAPEELGAAAIRYFALAVGDLNPLYFDGDVIAPPTLICETNQLIGTIRDPRTHGHDWGIAVPNTRLIRGGNAYVFERPVRPTDRITTRWRIADIAERTTSAGERMLVLTSVATYTSQDGELLATHTETRLFQELQA